MPISFLVAPDGVIEKVVFGQLTEEHFAEIEAVCCSDRRFGDPGGTAGNATRPSGSTRFAPSGTC